MTFQHLSTISHRLVGWSWMSLKACEDTAGSEYLRHVPEDVREQIDILEALQLQFWVVLSICFFVYFFWGALLKGLLVFFFFQIGFLKQIQ